VRLRKAGFDGRLTQQLSRECVVDLHALIELVERGCPPSLAARILAPLEHETRTLSAPPTASLGRA
jgi:hypothetical protein